jgi:SAM-dependent methyltransferase
MPSRKPAKARRPLVLNAGSGEPGNGALPEYFKGWRQTRVDVDPLAQPDLVASVADLSAIPDGSVDAVWCAHCIEHLFVHEVPRALAEFRRVMAAGGFACIIVPDIQGIAEWIAEDRLHETIYESASGPVTAHDMLWGFGPAIAQGNVAMAHRCGFTPTHFLNHLNSAGFAEIVLRRRSNLELRALVLAQASASDERRDALMQALSF